MDTDRKPLELVLTVIFTAVQLLKEGYPQDSRVIESTVDRSHAISNIILDKFDN